MEKKKVVVVNMNEQFVEEIINTIEQNEFMEIVAIASDGVEAKNKIYEFKPDIVIVDIFLPRIDGLGVIDFIETLDKKPLIAVTGAAISNSVNQLLIEKGIKIIMLQPIDIKLLAIKIKSFYSVHMSDVEYQERKRKRRKALEVLANKEFKDEELEKYIASKIHDLGVKASLKGHRLIIEAIRIKIQEPDKVKNITVDLYPYLAMKFNDTESKIERAIRHSIQCGYKNNTELYEGIFGSYKNGRPTNGNFIDTIADAIKIDISN